MKAVIKNKTKISNGFLKVYKVEVEQTTPTGETVNYVREVIERGHAAAIVLRDPKTDELVFTRQFRIGSAINGETNFMLDIVAGMIDKGDNAEQTVIRESLEEVGVENIRNVQQISPVFYPSVGGCSETLVVFYGEADFSNLPDFKGEISESEFIEVVKMKTDEALSQLHLFPTSASVVGLIWLSMQRQLGKI